MSAKSAFSTAIALLLLGLYVYLLKEAAAVVGCTQPNCKAAFTAQMASALSLIAGLIGALVISELALTEPGKPPVARALAPDASPRAGTILKIVTAVYLIVWVFCGVIALLIGFHHPTDVPAITDLGNAWLGLAIAAGYAYFGIKPT
jgi:hypothetical protein